MSNDWVQSEQDNHLKVIEDLLGFINKDSNQFVLKGGTGLLFGYGLDRFSEDIDLDARSKKSVISVLENYADVKGYDLNVTKDSNTVKRGMLDYGNENHKLKIETSYRKKNIISDEDVVDIDGIKVYSIDSLFSQKLAAMNSRSKIRDVYDVSFIYKNYKDEISDQSFTHLVDSLEHKGIEYMDYLLVTQEDTLIDKDELELNFLHMYEDLELEDDNLSKGRHDRISEKKANVINDFFDDDIEH